MIDETIRLDAYVEGVLAGRRPGPRPVTGDDLDSAMRRTADLLARALVRFHPSFRFEEALAARLRADAEAMRRGMPAGEPARAAAAIVDFRGGWTSEDARPHVQQELAAVRTRGLLVGGAIASGLSLAGAAYLAWRRGHRVAS